MWALRGASNPLKHRVHGLAAAALRFPGSNEYALLSSAEDSSRLSLPSALFQKVKLHTSLNNRLQFSGWNRGLSSQMEAKGGEAEDDSDDLFSELEIPLNKNAFDDNEDDVVVEPEDSDTDDGNVDTSDNMLSSLDAEADADKEKSTVTQWSLPELYLTVIKVPSSEVQSCLDKWIEDGKDLDRENVVRTFYHLRRRGLYNKALLMSEWLEAKSKYEFSEKDYASRIDLLAKVRGLHKAESYIKNVPGSFRGEYFYRCLLACYVSVTNLQKSEEVFNKMKDLGFPLSIFVCNQLLLLYKRLDKKKIADVLLLMEKEGIKPALFTYGLLIAAKASVNDLSGMEQILKAMEEEGMTPDIRIQAIMAKYYASAGYTEKAEAILKEMEEDHRACRHVLPIYAQLGKADEVSRIWKMKESEARRSDYLAAIEAWGILKNIQEAEATFNKMAALWKRLSLNEYSPLLQVYVTNKELNKGKNLLRTISENGIKLTSYTLNAMVKLYVDSGEVEKADSMLFKAAEQTRLRPMFSSLIEIMDQYAKRGDVHNSEKIFLKMKDFGYEARARQFASLLLAYVNAKAPAYGLKERMKADNIFPNREMASQLGKVDPFKSTSISKLLD